ncbi:MAG TPA: hypothetical protein VMU33_00605 [Burkholderiaceae bacterium]|nr:hypothetical protein [Burkholderiaceae bacterium]
MNEPLADLGRRLAVESNDGRGATSATTGHDAADDEPLFGTASAIVLAVSIGALFWAALFVLAS